MRSKTWPYLAHLPVVLFMFWGVLVQGRVPFVRDILTHYYPDYVFLAQSASQGVGWPLWNPLIHAGAPFLVPYPFDILLVRAFGPLTALRLDAPFHVLLAMCGASFLARQRGLGLSGAWAAGVLYGLSGFLLSSSNLMQFFHAVSWAPWVIAALLRVWRAPDARGCAFLGVALALQVSTLAADVVLQTAFACLFLLPCRPSLRHVRACVGAVMLALLLSAPVLLGTRALLEGTRRAAGFGAAEALARAANPIVLVESLVPHFFGDVRDFSGLHFWGQPFFDGYPLFMSLYLGPGVMLLALLAGFRRAAAPLWALAVLGALMSLGANGPLGSPLLLFLHYFRFPIKFFFLTNLALCLLAGMGVDRCGREAPVTRLRYVPAVLFVGVALALTCWPDVPRRFLGLRLFEDLVPAPFKDRAIFVMSQVWPRDLLLTGSICLAAALALRMKSWRGALVTGLVVLDLMSVNLVLNRTAPPDFYALEPSVRALADRAAAAGAFRWFSFGPEPDTLSQGRLPSLDVRFYSVARQMMLGSSSAIDGFESAMEVEESFAPANSTIPLALRAPENFRIFFPQVRLANVRWVLSPEELPTDLVTLVALPRIRTLEGPFRFYEVKDPVPRAFWTPRCEVVPDGSQIWGRTLSPYFDAQRSVLLEEEPPGGCDRVVPGEAAVSMERPDPHTVKLKVRSPPGFIVVIEGFHRDWRAQGPSGPVPVLRAHVRYWALPTPGGEQEFVVRFTPRWPRLALGLGALGLTVAAALFWFRGARGPREWRAGAGGALSIGPDDRRSGHPRGPAPDSRAPP
jgi:hypothetical protein